MNSSRSEIQELEAAVAVDQVYPRKTSRDGWTASKTAASWSDFLGYWLTDELRTVSHQHGDTMASAAW